MSGIPDEWEWQSIAIKRLGPFKYGYKKLPVAWFKEGTSQFQMLCPYCDYAKGFNEAVLAVPETWKRKVCVCKTCGTEFVGVG